MAFNDLNNGALAADLLARANELENLTQAVMRAAPAGSLRDKANQLENKAQAVMRRAAELKTRLMATSAPPPSPAPSPAPTPGPSPTPPPAPPPPPPVPPVVVIGKIDRSRVPASVQTGMASSIPYIAPILAKDVPAVGFEGVRVDDWLLQGNSGPSIHGLMTMRDVGAYRQGAQVTHGFNADSLVFPGDPRPLGSHHHFAWGNPATDENTGYESAVTADVVGSSEGGPLNRSAKWAPSLITYEGEIVIPEYITEYYKQVPYGSAWFKAQSAEFQRMHNAARPRILDIDGKDTGRFPEVVPIPNGLRYIVGRNCPPDFYAGTNDAPVHFAIWLGDKDGQPDGPSHSGTDLAALLALTTPGQTFWLRLDANAPPAWDGIHAAVPDHHSHMANVKWNPAGFSWLPETHPFLIPAIQMKPFWRIGPEVRDPRKLTFTCDIDAPGDRMHMEYLEGWHPATKLAWHNSSILEYRNSSGGAIGDGRYLKRPPCFSFGNRGSNLVTPDRDGKFRLVDLQGNRLT